MATSSPNGDDCDTLRCSVEIDLDDLQSARGDERLAATLRAARAEGARVEREGRQRWAMRELPSATTIDRGELQVARRDKRLLQILRAAQAEGARVVREGRQRW